jgi:hypothetical protein
MSKDALIGKALTIDPALPDFILTVDGAARHLRFDFLTFRIYQKKTGDDPFALGFRVSIANLDSLLWAAVSRNHSEVTLEDVQNWLTPSNAEQIFDFVVEAYNASCPAAQAEDGNASQDPPSA